MAARGDRAVAREVDFDDAPSTLALLTQIIATPLRLSISPPALRAYARTALLFLTAVTLYLVAVVAYVVFYNAYVPDASFTVPIHLQFDHLPHSGVSGPPVYQPYAITHVASSRSRVLGRWQFGRWFSFGSGSHAVERGWLTARPGRMISDMEYDIDVVIAMPRTPANLAAGNFMLELSMLGPQPLEGSKSASAAPVFGSGSEAVSAPISESDGAVLARSSRPATLTYTSPLLSHTVQLLTMPLYVFNFRTESETLRVPMLENIAFPRRSSATPGVPERLRFDIKSSERLQIYTVNVEVQARFSGVRWLMSRHRVFSLVLFSTLFWFCEMAFAVFIWGLALIITSLASFSSPGQKSYRKTTHTSSHSVGSSEEEEKRGRLPPSAVVKSEDAEEEGPDLSDTDRTFPTYSRQPPLRYSSPPQVKDEDEADGESIDPNFASGLNLGPNTAGEADDEDEDADFIIGEPSGRLQGEFHDSGIGTSMESSGGAVGGTARKRKSNR